MLKSGLQTLGILRRLSALALLQVTAHRDVSDVPSPINVSLCDGRSSMLTETAIMDAFRGKRDWTGVPTAGPRVSLESGNYSVGLERRHGHVEYPQAGEQAGGGYLVAPRSSELSTTGLVPADEEDDAGDESADAEYGHGKGEVSGLYLERASAAPVHKCG